MTELLVAPEKDNVKAHGCSKTAYDMTMGASQMLGCLEEKLKDINDNAMAGIFYKELRKD